MVISKSNFAMRTEIREITFVFMFYSAQLANTIIGVPVVFISEKNVCVIV